MTARLMLEHKGLEYRRVDLIPTVHMVFLRAAGFPRPTVPALKIDGRRVQGSLAVPRVLDELQPDPPLFPSDPQKRREVEEAESWGESVLQPVPRRLAWWGMKQNRAALRSFAEGARLHVPLGLATRTAGPIIRWEIRTHDARDRVVREDLAELGAMLERIEGWIDRGVLGARDLNAADFQIATSVRLLMCLDDLRPAVRDRPAGAWAERVVPVFPGKIGPVFPPDWLRRGPEPRTLVN
jgi:glutathione S-transferase